MMYGPMVNHACTNWTRVYTPPATLNDVSFATFARVGDFCPWISTAGPRQNGEDTFSSSKESSFLLFFFLTFRFPRTVELLCMFFIPLFIGVYNGVFVVDRDVDYDTMRISHRIKSTVHARRIFSNLTFNGNPRFSRILVSYYNIR